MVIVGEIEENDDKVRSVYGGSVEQAACRNLARSCAPKPGRIQKTGRRSHAEARPRSYAPKPCRRSRSEARPGAGNCPARPGPARPGPGRRRERDGKDGLDDGRDHLCM